MTLDDLRRYTVKFENGSGCIFQPLEPAYTYILSAKHLFYDEVKARKGVAASIRRKADGTAIKIFQQHFDGIIWSQPEIPFELQHGVNYFEHESADIAILKIEPALEGFDMIVVEEEYKIGDGFAVCGFPMELRAGLEYARKDVLGYIGSVNYGYSAQLAANLSHAFLIGMSGCGLLKLGNQNIAVMGIQSRMATTGLAAGQIGFVPIKFAKEIIDYPAYAGKLEQLLPPYFASFKFLKDGLFDMQLSLITKKKGDKLTGLLTMKAQEIQDSRLTPNAIKEFLQSRLPDIYKQDAQVMKLKKVWVLWFELLTVLNIVKEKKYCLNDLENIFKEVRIFYTDIDTDYWLSELDNLPWKDYKGLANGGMVVCASNIGAVDNTHVLNINIPDLSWVEKAKYEFDKKNYVINTDEAMPFPMTTYNFVNISYFKEGTLPELGEAFKNGTPEDCINILKTLYAKIFGN